MVTGLAPHWVLKRFGFEVNVDKLRQVFSITCFLKPCPSSRQLPAWPGQPLSELGTWVGDKLGGLRHVGSEPGSDVVAEAANGCQGTVARGCCHLRPFSRAGWRAGGSQPGFPCYPLCLKLHEGEGTGAAVSSGLLDEKLTQHPRGCACQQGEPLAHSKLFPNLQST